MSGRFERYVGELGRRVGAMGGLRPRLEEEVVEHLRDAAAEYRRRGWSPAEAEEQAIRDFGPPDLVARPLLEDAGDLVQPLRALLAPPLRRAARPFVFA
ncbi:MAG TPA: permease prefix domain 1-containing protein [Candidatus Dormibacteraeota bacterium]|nr:permease prefix domain 1-containing protein [Candidatus Dormibacteraeota bacterium]